MGNLKIKIDDGTRETLIVLCAIGIIGSLELVALLLGHNGQILMAVIAIVAGAAGLMIPKPNIKRLIK